MKKNKLFHNKDYVVLLMGTCKKAHIMPNASEIFKTYTTYNNIIILSIDQQPSRKNT